MRHFGLCLLTGLLLGLPFAACDGESEDTPLASAGSGGSAAGGAGTTSGGAAGAPQGGGGAAPLDASAPQSVWPGSSTRYYPGIYPLLAVRGVGSLQPSVVQSHFDAWFGGREDDYVETVNGHAVTHLGVTLLVDAALLFDAHWRSSAVAPYDWKGACARVAEAQLPDAAPDGLPLYDFSLLDEVLALPFVASQGGRVIVRIMETYTNADDDRTCRWMRDEGYVKPGTSGGWSYFQMQDSAVVYMWQDIMAALAAHYQGDSRIAAMLFDETYPSLWQNEELCGPVHDLPVEQAANAGLMEIMSASLAVDPDMLWAIVNWFPAAEPAIDVWEQGYGGATLGANDLPGVQGHYVQDPRFLDPVGAGAPCSEDANMPGIYLNQHLAQHYGVTRTAPVFMSSEANGWYVEPHDRRVGGANPWNVAEWPLEGDSLPNDDGDLFPSARFAIWYFSGEPRASSESDRDSSLGKSGADPCGVTPATFYCPYVPDWAPDDRPGWTPENLSIDHWLRAVDTFGPRGTGAMFAHPDGYLAQY